MVSAFKLKSSISAWRAEITLPRAALTPSSLNSFISLGLWDEARVFTNNRLNIGNGVKAPEFRFECAKDEANDGISLRYFYNNDFYTRKFL